MLLIIPNTESEPGFLRRSSPFKYVWLYQNTLICFHSSFSLKEDYPKSSMIILMHHYKARLREVDLVSVQKKTSD